MEVEASQGHIVPFMEQLKALCRHLDKEVSQMKEEINHPPGEKPYHYSAAMKEIKTDVEELKKSSSEAKSKLVLMDNFSSFLETTNELVDEQEKSISSMEEYLKKFGYTPLEISSEADSEKMEDIENSSPETNSHASSKRPSAGHCSSPVLSEVGRSVIQGNDITQNLANIVKQKTHVSLKENPIFEASRNEMELGHENPMEEKQTFDLVTNQYSGRPLPFLANNESTTIKHEQKKIMDDLPKDRTIAKDKMSLPAHRIPDPSTPVTPELSEATMSLFNLISKKENNDPKETNTPEEPSLYYKEKNKQYGSLNDTAIPDEPVLSNMYGKINRIPDPRTPVTPELSDATMSLLNLISKKGNNDPKETKKQYGSLNDTAIPDEPVLSNMYGKMQVDDNPESPVVSEATKSLFKSILSSHASKDLYAKTPVTSEFYNATKEHSNRVTRKDKVGLSEANTPEEPILNCNYSSKYSYQQTDTPEEPILSSANAGKDNIDDDDMPPSPELSSYTQSFLKTQPQVRANPHSDMRRNLYDVNKYESMMNNEYSNENMSRSYQSNEYPVSRYTNEVKPHMYDVPTKDEEYPEQENDDPTSYINNSSYMNKSTGASNFSFITPAKERGNVNRSYSLAMERLANVNDSPDSPQLSEISLSVVNRSQRW